MDIYPARELPIQGINSDWLLGKINSKTKKLVTKNTLMQSIKNIDNPILVTMGAGDIDLIADELTNNLLKNEI